MANEAITRVKFFIRLSEVAPSWFAPLDEDTQNRLADLAWEECAWISTLTDERILHALADAAKKEGIAT